jgi:hypothetical protein
MLTPRGLAYPLTQFFLLLHDYIAALPLENSEPRLIGTKVSDCSFPLTPD